jgi:hypothetical protein
MTGRIPSAVEARVKSAFAGLNKQGPAQSFPQPLSLSNTLGDLVPGNRKGTVVVPGSVARLFATAAVDIWLRGVHSFLISASLTRASPVWSCVTGYYASHYSVRAIAHLLGFFNLRRKGAIAQFNVQGGQLRCDFTNKGAGTREHGFYWKVVHNDSYFADDPLFPLNDDNAVISDAAHRGRANYADHLQRVPAFQVLDQREIKDRIERISEMEFDAPPIPSCDKFPDLDSVQIVAYQRIIRFREFVDDVVGTTNRFWAVHRDPRWVRGVMDFQMTNQAGLAAGTSTQ